MLEKSRGRRSDGAREKPPSACSAEREGDSRGTLDNGNGDGGDPPPEPTGNRIAHSSVGKRIERFHQDLAALLDGKGGERFPISNAYGLQDLYENPFVPRRSPRALSSSSASSFADLPPLPTFSSASPAKKQLSKPSSSSRVGSRPNLSLTSDKNSSLTEASTSVTLGDKPGASARDADAGGGDARRYPRGRNVRSHVLAVQRELEEEEERERNARQHLEEAVVPSPPNRSEARTSRSLPGMASGRRANVLPGMGTGKQTNTLPGMSTAHSLIEGGSRDLNGLGNMSKDSGNGGVLGSSDVDSNRQRANDAEEARRAAEKVQLNGLGNISKDSGNGGDVGSSDDDSIRRRANDAEETRRDRKSVV